jgi:hypothetical protein
MKSLLDRYEVSSGQTMDQTRVLTQQVHNSYFDRLIVLNFLLDFFPGVEKILLVDINNVSPARPSTIPELRVNSS